MTTLKILSTRAVQGALPGLSAAFARAAGTEVALEFGPTNALLARIKGGETADVAILTRAGVDELGELGIVDGASTVDLVRSVVGLAVKMGAQRPDIGTPAALKATLLAARSLAYSRLG